MNTDQFIRECNKRGLDPRLALDDRELLDAMRVRNDAAAKKHLDRLKRERDNGKG